MNDRRPEFGAYTIERTITLSPDHGAVLVRMLSTDAGYIASEYVCGYTDPPTALGLRLVRGPVVLDFAIQCGNIALGTTPDTDSRPSDTTGIVAGEVLSFLVDRGWRPS